MKTRISRKKKKDKSAYPMRAVVADNLKRFMEEFYAKRPHIRNRPMDLATEAGIGLGTVQRTLVCETGVSIDTLEALSKVLCVSVSAFLEPSERFQSMMGKAISTTPNGAPLLKKRRGNARLSLVPDNRSRG